jgi:mannose-6-phosphate isomerase-like protein (cupin superfamily)
MSGPDAIAPDGSEIHLRIGVPEGATRASLCEVRLAAGAVSRPVRHRSVEEIWYVLEGEGAVWRSAAAGEGERVAVRPGDALVIPTGWRFQFRAEARAPLRFLCYTTPPWPGPDEALPAEPGGLGPATV